MKKCLVVRYGAIGDCIIITPVLKRLKELRYHVIFDTNKRGMAVFKHDDRIDELIEHDESMPLDKVRDHWEKQKKEIKHDKYINFSESLECNVALHPSNPAYIYSKPERFKRCNYNYYDVTAKWAGLDNCDKIPSLQFTEEETESSKAFLKEGKFNILWCMSGSGANKVYPWSDFVIGEVLKNFEDTHLITVGDEKCQLLETLPSERVTNLSGEVDIRTSMCLTQFVNLVISPDTGILHASGCYLTPKIGLLGHTTKENITKHFYHDYSIEAECECAPCNRLIYDIGFQCPVDPVIHGAWCMTTGIPPERVYDAVKAVKERARILKEFRLSER